MRECRGAAQGRPLRPPRLGYHSCNRPLGTLRLTTSPPTTAAGRCSKCSSPQSRQEQWFCTEAEAEDNNRWPPGRWLCMQVLGVDRAPTFLTAGSTRSEFIDHTSLERSSLVCCLVNTQPPVPVCRDVLLATLVCLGSRCFYTPRDTKDVALWVTLLLSRLPSSIYLGRVGVFVLTSVPNTGAAVRATNATKFARTSGTRDAATSEIICRCFFCDTLQLETAGHLLIRSFCLSV